MVCSRAMSSNFVSLQVIFSFILSNRWILMIIMDIFFVFLNVQLENLATYRLEIGLFKEKKRKKKRTEIKIAFSLRYPNS